MIKKYEHYKDSGVEWLGEIPEHWNTLPIRAIFEERNEKNDGRKTDFILSVTKDRGVIPYEEKGAIGNNKSEDIERYKLVYPNDFVINKMNVVIGSLGMSKYFGAFSQVYLVYRPKTEQINMNYYSYLFSNPSFYKSLIKYCKGIMELRESLDKNDFKKLILPFPEINVQTKIAQFLDDKTQKIDQAISIKEQQIALLKEHKQILIHKAVTGQLIMENGKWIMTPKEKMKDSGVQWIGEIPEHWEVKKFRFLFNLGKGLTITKQNLQEEGVYCVNYGEIHSKYGFELDTNIHKLKCVDNEYLLTNQNALINYGDFVFADTSEDIEGSGNFTYLESKEEIFAGYHTVVAKPKLDIVPRFFAYIFESESFRNQIRTKVKGVKVYSITQAILKEPFVWFPSMEEQERIVNYLDSGTRKIDTAISLKAQEIEKLKEYKSSLINSVVTGKVKIIEN